MDYSFMWWILGIVEDAKGYFCEGDVEEGINILCSAIKRIQEYWLPYSHFYCDETDS